MNRFNLSNRISVVNAAANIDASYGPYASIAEATAAIPVGLRVVGKTVGITTDGVVAEYWWRTGVADGDLESKEDVVGNFTAEELKILASQNKLIPEKAYIITDFQTVHTIQHTQDTNVGPTEEIIVKSKTDSTFYREASSLTFPGEELIIDLFPEDASDINFDMDLAFYDLHKNYTTYASVYNGTLTYITNTYTAPIDTSTYILTDTYAQGIHKWSLKITAIADSDGITELTVFDDGKGGFEGDGTGVVDYETGEFSLTFNELVEPSSTLNVSCYSKDSILSKGLIRERYTPPSDLFGGFYARFPYDWRVVRFRRWAFSFDTGSQYPYLIGEPKTYCLSNPVANYIGVNPQDNSRQIAHLQANVEEVAGPDLITDYWHLLHNFIPDDLNDYVDYFTCQQTLGHPDPVPTMTGGTDYIGVPYRDFDLPSAPTGSMHNTMDSDDVGTKAYITNTRDSLKTDTTFTFNNIVILSRLITLNASKYINGNTKARMCISNFTFISYATNSLANYTYEENTNGGYECAIYYTSDTNGDYSYDGVFGAHRGNNPSFGFDSQGGINHNLFIGYCVDINGTGFGTQFVWSNRSCAVNQMFSIFEVRGTLPYFAKCVTLIDTWSRNFSTSNVFLKDFSFATLSSNAPFTVNSGTYYSNSYNDQWAIVDKSVLQSCRYLIDFSDPIHGGGNLYTMVKLYYMGGSTRIEVGNTRWRQYAALLNMSFDMLSTIQEFYLGNVNTLNSLYGVSIASKRRSYGEVQPTFLTTDNLNPSESADNLPLKIGHVQIPITDVGGIKVLYITPTQLRNLGSIEIMPEGVETENSVDKILMKFEVDGITMGTTWSEQVISYAPEMWYGVYYLLGVYFGRDIDIFPTAGLKVDINLTDTGFDYGANNATLQKITLDGDNYFSFLKLKHEFTARNVDIFHFTVEEVNQGTLSLPDITAFVSTTEIPLDSTYTTNIAIQIAASQDVTFTSKGLYRKLAGTIENTDVAPINITLLDNVVGTIADGTGTVSISGTNVVVAIPATSSIYISGEVVNPAGLIKLEIII